MEGKSRCVSSAWLASMGASDPTRGCGGLLGAWYGIRSSRRGSARIRKKGRQDRAPVGPIIREKWLERMRASWTDDSLLRWLRLMGTTEGDKSREAPQGTSSSKHARSATKYSPTGTGRGGGSSSALLNVGPNPQRSKPWLWGLRSLVPRSVQVQISIRYGASDCRV